MNIFVRPIKQEDKEKLLDWYSKSDLFDHALLQIPDIFILCAFKKAKILGFLIVETKDFAQALLRFIPNPEATDLEKAAASVELTKQCVFLAYSGGQTKIYFQGSHPGTNKITSHVFNHAFKMIPTEEYKHIFEETKYPVYLLELKDLE